MRLPVKTWLRPTLLLAALLVLLGTPVFCKNNPQLLLLKESRIWINGHSTFHPFSSETQTFEMTAKVSSNILENPEILSSSPEKAIQHILQNKQITQLGLHIDVESLKSGDREFDRSLYRLMKSKTHKAIIFNLKSHELHPFDTPSTFNITAEGDLEIAGVKKTISVRTIAFIEKDSLRFTGKKTLLMSDYGIQWHSFKKK